MAWPFACRMFVLTVPQVQSHDTLHTPWAVRRARRDGLVLEEVDMEGTYFRSRIGENMRRAMRAWFDEGRAEGYVEGVEEGRAEGVEEGLEQQRVLLGRQAATKFGAKASARVGPLLAQIADPESTGRRGPRGPQCCSRIVPCHVIPEA